MRREAVSGIDHRRARARRRKGREGRCEGHRRAAGFLLVIGIRIKKAGAIKLKDMKARANNCDGSSVHELNVNTGRTDPLSGKAGHARRRRSA